MDEFCREEPPRPRRSRGADVPEVPLDQVYQRHAEAIRRALARLGVPQPQLDDAVQDVFVVLLRRVADFDPRYGARGWLLGIARRVASGYRRSSGRWHACRQRLTFTGRDPEPTLEDHLARREARAMLSEFLNTLDQEKSAVYMLAEVQGLRGPEIARALDVNLNTVYWRLRIAREAFETMVERRKRELDEQSTLPGWLTPFGLGPVPAWQTGRGLQLALSVGVMTGVTSATVVADGPTMPDPLTLESAEPVTFASASQRWIPEDDGMRVWPAPPEPPSRRTVVRRPPPVREPAPPGAVSPPAVAKTSVLFTVRSHINEIRACYNAALVRDPTIVGRVETVFQIGASGIVTSVEIGESDIAETSLHQCMAQRIHQWTFPAAETGSSIVVRYPFVFAPHCGDRDPATKPQMDTETPPNPSCPIAPSRDRA